MKRMIVFMLVIALVLSISVTAFAVTPSYKFPSLPSVPDISDNIQVTVSSGFWSNWFASHPIKLPSLKLPG